MARASWKDGFSDFVALVQGFSSPFWGAKKNTTGLKIRVSKWRYTVEVYMRGPMKKSMRFLNDPFTFDPEALGMHWLATYKSSSMSQEWQEIQWPHTTSSNPTVDGRNLANHPGNITPCFKKQVHDLFHQQYCVSNIFQQHQYMGKQNVIVEPWTMAICVARHALYGHLGGLFGSPTCIALDQSPSRPGSSHVPQPAGMRPHHAVDGRDLDDVIFWKTNHVFEGFMHLQWCRI